MKRFLSWFWPTITNYATAHRAVMYGYIAACVLALVFFFTAFLSVYTFQAGMPDHRWDLLDAFVFMFTGWMIKGDSRGFAFAGTFFCVFEIWARFSPITLPVWMLLLLLFINSVRGTCGTRRFPPPPPVQPT